MSIVCQDLHAAILANPLDHAIRLVYADWLEEHGEWMLSAFHRTIGENKIRPSASKTGKSVEWFLEYDPFPSSYTDLPWMIDPSLFARLEAQKCRFPASVMRCLEPIPDEALRKFVTPYLGKPWLRPGWPWEGEDERLFHDLLVVTCERGTFSQFHAYPEPSKSVYRKIEKAYVDLEAAWCRRWKEDPENRSI